MPNEPLRDGSVTVVLADDHAVVRKGLRLLIDGEPGLRVVGEAGTVEDAVDATRTHPAAVLVLDLHMPDGSALAAIHTMSERATTRIVVLTMDNDPSVARAALRAGALGFVVKEAADDELFTAIRYAARGEAYLSPHIAARIAAPASEPSVPPDDLSDRELEVLRLVVLGFTSPEIAQQLRLSARTVETHRTHIQQKTRRSSRAELVRYAITNGLLDVEVPPMPAP